MGKIKTTLEWTLIVIPPLLLLPLAFISVDIHTILYWLFGWSCLIVSAFSLYSKIIEEQRSIKNLLRPILTIIIFSFAYLSLSTSLNAARVEATMKAHELLSICDQGKCPAFIEGWRSSEHVLGESYTSVGYLIKYPLFYQPSEHLDTFKLSLRVSFEEEYNYKPKNGSIIVEHLVW